MYVSSITAVSIVYLDLQNEQSGQFELTDMCSAKSSISKILNCTSVWPATIVVLQWNILLWKTIASFVHRIRKCSAVYYHFIKKHIF